MDCGLLAAYFDEEIKDAGKYQAMARKAEGHERQVLHDIALEECTHAKHLCMMMQEHGVDVHHHMEALSKMEMDILR